MNRQDLERLAANPNYKLSKKQLEELRKLRMHDPSYQIHDTNVRMHTVKPPQEQLTSVSGEKRNQRGKSSRSQMSISSNE